MSARPTLRLAGSGPPRGRFVGAVGPGRARRDLRGDPAHQGGLPLALASHDDADTALGDSPGPEPFDLLGLDVADVRREQPRLGLFLGMRLRCAADLGRQGDVRRPASIRPWVRREGSWRDVRASPLSSSADGRPEGFSGGPSQVTSPRRRSACRLRRGSRTRSAPAARGSTRARGPGRTGWRGAGTVRGWGGGREGLLAAYAVVGVKCVLGRMDAHGRHAAALAARNQTAHVRLLGRSVAGDSLAGLPVDGRLTRSNQITSSFLGPLEQPTEWARRVC